MTLRILWQHIRLDIVRSRWLIVAFIAALTLYVNSPDLRAPGVEPATDPMGTAGLPSYALLVMVAGLLLSSLIRNDSPTTEGAYWRTTPLSGTLLLGQKVAVVFLAMILPAIAANSVVLTRFVSSPAQVTQVTVLSLSASFSWLLAIFLLAAITPTLTTFILALIAYGAALLGYVAAASYFPDRIQQQIEQDHFHFGAVFSVVLTAWLVSVYITRHRSTNRTRVVSACVLLLPMSAAILYAIILPVAPEAAQLAMVPSNFHVSFDSGTMIAQFDVPAPRAGHKLLLDELQLAAQTSSEKGVPLILTMFRSSGSSTINGVTTRHEGAILEPGTDAFTIDSTRSPAIAHIRLRMAPADSLQIAAMSRSSLTLNFSGILVTQRTDTVIRIPLTLDMQHLANGTFLQASIVANPDSGSTLRLESWRVGGSALEQTTPASNASSETATRSQTAADRVRLDLGASGSSFSLLSSSGRDTLQMSEWASHGSAVPLPIPGTSARYDERKLARMESSGIPLTERDVRGATLIGTVLRADSRQFLKASAPVR